MTHSTANMPRVIGLYSSYPGAGKTTVAKYLERKGYTRVSLADPLRRMVKVLIYEFGYTPFQADQFLTVDKESIIPEIGRSARYLLRTIGTEWGRDHVHADIWIRTWQAMAGRILANGGMVVCDDMRFPNEASTIQQKHGSQLWRISRDSVAPTIASGHRSDGGLDVFDFDVEILNDKSVDGLHACVDRLLGPER
jgi:hypothetical protein